GRGAEVHGGGRRAGQRDCAILACGKASRVRPPAHRQRQAGTGATAVLRALGPPRIACHYASCRRARASGAATRASTTEPGGGGVGLRRPVGYRGPVWSGPVQHRRPGTVRSSTRSRPGRNRSVKTTGGHATPPERISPEDVSSTAGSEERGSAGLSADSFG